MQIFSNTVVPDQMAATQTADTSASNGSDSSSASSATGSATITANDFLQLLVTEMQNQDPTADTDPNEYINQLVQVNSLEQLVQINQDLGGSSASSSATGSSSDSASSTTASGTASAAALNAPIGNAAAPATAPGNLSEGSPGNGAAQSVAKSLSTAAQTLAPGAQSSPLQSAIAALKQRAHAAHTSTSNPAR